MGDVVHVQLDERGYDILLGHGFEAVLGHQGNRDSALIISDSHVDPLYGPVLQSALEMNGYRCARVVVPAGEGSKSLVQAGELFERAFDARLDRKGLIVALGGGVVGDLAGFVAATYLRGVRLLQVPTSLLAMVDSSVGGKTAVNLSRGKNLVGVFYQPCQVAVNLDTLRTLPDREYRSGLAEVVKYGVIRDESFFESLEEDADALNARDEQVLQDVIARCCEIKAEVVGQDERESGVRAILNYGHTLGHAIETVCGYGQLLHGEAVALGMVYAGLVSCRERGLAAEEAARVVGLMERLGLPVRRRALADAVTWERLREAMSADKKARHSVPTFVLADRIGSVSEGCVVPEAVLKAAFDAME
jgi:3-dehydroquinate synthase